MSLKKASHDMQKLLYIKSILSFSWNWFHGKLGGKKATKKYHQTSSLLERERKKFPDLNSYHWILSYIFCNSNNDNVMY